MKKIPSVFARNYETDRKVRNEVVPGCEWVLLGEGQPTVKIDGTCCLVRDGRLYKRYDAKQGKTPPEGWEAAQPEPDPITHHWPGWLLVTGKPEDRWHIEAYANTFDPDVSAEDGTYELIGPKVQGNPYGRTSHRLVRHGAEPIELPIRTYESIQKYLEEHVIEGIVFHHPDGRMAKIKRRDFGLKWPVK